MRKNGFYCNNRKAFLESGFKGSIKKKVIENESSCVLGTRIFIRVYQTACIFQKI